ncbi:MAG: hypothetical protein DIU68_018600 [Chloroflexota bacterium]|nr:MAG: hypothetical protein DIU68_00555 [Chloroflexota bacterium]
MADAQATSKRQRFEELMRAGIEAYRQEKHRLAHDYWREAATLDPYNEKVWLALYRVINTDEDRLVCLRNIIAINPANVQARKRLQALERKMASGTPPVVKPQPATPRPSGAHSETGQRRRSLLARLLFVVLVAGILGALSGIIASILIYGGW